MMSEKRTYQKPSYERKRLIWLVFIGMLACLCVAGTCFFQYKNQQYKPPKFEENAVKGEVEVGGKFNHSVASTDYGFSFGIAKNLYLQKDKSLVVMAANSEKNSKYLQYQIIDKGTKEVLYKTGILRPGEYVEKINPASEVKNKKYEIIIQINAFEPDTWYSAGKIEIGWLLQPWVEK